MARNDGRETLREREAGPSRRSFLKGMGVAAAWAGTGASTGALLEACASGSNQPASGTPARGGQVTQSIIGDVRSFNPLNTTDLASTAPQDLLYEPLVATDASFNLHGRLAKSAPMVSPDGLTYTYELVQNASWSDGQPITADDVKFTFDCYMLPQYSKLPVGRATFQQHVADYRVVDKYTFVCRLKAVFPTWAAQGFSIVPRHIFGDMSQEQILTTDYNLNPTATSGPFKFGSWQRGQSVTLVRNDRFYRVQARLDKWNFRVLSSPTDVFNQLQTGEVDLGQIDNSQIDAALKNPKLKVLTWVAAGYSAVGFNLGTANSPSKLFSDARVRQALYLAMDRQSILKSVYFGQGVVSNAVITSSLAWAWNKDNQPTYAYDKAKAIQLMSQAGWIPGAGGIRQKDGVPLRFTLMAPISAVTPSNLGLILQQNWKDVGADVGYSAVDFATQWTPAMQKGNFDALLYNFGNGNDPDNLTRYYSSDGLPPAGLNYMRYSNAAVDRLLVQGGSTLDQAKRRQAYVEIQHLLAQDLPALPIVALYGNWTLNARLRNYQVGATQDKRLFYPEVWVTDGK